MKISLNWLRDYVALPQNLEPQKLADRLSLSVAEVEGYEREADQFAKMVVGRVLAVRHHPNADRLKVCSVDVGKSVISNFQFPISKQIQNPKFQKSDAVQIVCGGKNVKEGMLVAVALPGAKVRWHGEGELVELKEAEVRGVKSYGMICAGEEIGLGDMQERQPMVGEDPQILDLSFLPRSSQTIFPRSRSSSRGAFPSEKSLGLASVKPGMPLAVALGKDDVVFEISNVSLSNRPDLWSHYGIAREGAGLYGPRLRPLENPKSKIPNPKQYSKFKTQNSKLSVKVDDRRLCPRYMGTLVENVHIAETPEWMVKRLTAVGQRLINPLVDISNYVMFEMGQPVHIFDKSKMVDIVVRRAKEGERLTTLDGVKRVLDRDMLVIADYEKPIAIAGVMGGEDTGVNKSTSSIVIECATFEPVSVRKTSVRLDLKTDATQRFEKSLDPHLPPLATARVLQLLQECAVQGKIPEVCFVVDVSAKIAVPKFIRLPLEMLDHRVGMIVPRAHAKKILLGLGFSVKGTAKEWRGNPPPWRATRGGSIPSDFVEGNLRHF